MLKVYFIVGKDKNYSTFADHLVERTIYFTNHYQLTFSFTMSKPKFTVEKNDENNIEPKNDKEDDENRLALIIILIAIAALILFILE
jgi:hypothetical protein